MDNGPTRAELWKSLIVERCEYPAPALLRAQIKSGEAHDFCECGCNSFALRVDPAELEPLLPPDADRNRQGRRSIYHADFFMSDGKTLEIVLFADARGHLNYVEVDCCANSYPVPVGVVAERRPFHTWAAGNLFRET